MGKKLKEVKKRDKNNDARENFQIQNQSTANSIYSLIPSQINIKPHTKGLSPSVSFTQLIMSGLEQNVQCMLKGRK